MAQTSRFQKLPPENSLSESQKGKVAQISDQLIALWKHLFDVQDQAKLDSIVSSGLDTTEIDLRELEVDLQVHPPQLKVLIRKNEDVASAEEQVPLLIPAVPETIRRAEQIRASIQRDDIWSFAFAAAIAAITGLSTSYFGQSFGTAKDYVQLFIWAVGTKVVMDFLGSALDTPLKMSSISNPFSSLS